MRFQYLGTAAAEGVPALWCHCAVCEASLERGGRNVRTRSQILINDDLLVDFSADTYMHFLRWGMDLCKVRNLIVTHTHEDHFYPADLTMIRPGFSVLPDDYMWTVWGSEAVGKAMEKEVFSTEGMRYMEFKEMKPFVTYKVGNYDVTPLPARHDPNAGAFLYVISDGKSTVFLGNDSGPFFPEVWDYLEKANLRFDMISLDCTCGYRFDDPTGHMNFKQNLAARDRFLAMGKADEKTVFICHHFSHNGVRASYEEFAPLAMREGFLTSYDGMILHL